MDQSAMSLLTSASGCFFDRALLIACASSLNTVKLFFYHIGSSLALDSYCCDQ
jgi:hypothetical protein